MPERPKLAGSPIIELLQKIDGEYFLPIHASLVEQLQTDEHTPLDLIVDGGLLTASPRHTVARPEVVAAIARRLMTIHAETLRKLAE